MPTSEIGVSGLALSAILVAVAVGISVWRGLGLERTILWSCGRALVQLLVVGVALVLVVEPGRPIALSLLWVAGMVGFAAATIRNRAPEVPGILPLAAMATAVTVVVSLIVIFGLGIFPFDARAVIPLAGMMVGNSMSATVVAARRVVGELRDKRDQVEARLALGHTAADASRPYVREAMRTAMIPQIESTKAVGLVFLPGAMTGLILAGVDPEKAVMVQLAIMYLILGSVATSVTVMGLGVARRLFTEDHRLQAER